MQKLFDDPGEEPGDLGAEPGVDDGRPLAARVRPRRLEELVGQAHLLGAGSALRAGDRAGAAPLDGALRSARLGQDDASADDRGDDRARRSRSYSAVGRPGAPRCVR